MGFVLLGTSGPEEHRASGRGQSPRARGRYDSPGSSAASTLRGESPRADSRRAPTERPDPDPARTRLFPERAGGAGDPLRAAGRVIPMRRPRSTEISTFTIVKGSLIPETYAA